MTFLRNKKKYHGKVMWMGVFVALFLVFAVFNDSVGQFAAKPVMFAARPFLQLSNSVGDWLAGNMFIIETKKSLKRENIELKERISEFEAKILSCELKEKENEELKTLLFADEGGEFLASPILSRPPQSPYDILIIAAGSKKGIKTGMRATAYGNILLGYVSEVFGETSKIKLISFPSEENNVSLVSSGISAIAIGLGGENLEITLPRAIEIKVGERVTALGFDSLLAGIVEKIQTDPADPFQKILFRLPVNIQELKYVMIKAE